MPRGPSIVLLLPLHFETLRSDEGEDFIFDDVERCVDESVFI